jgi:hypothetical protein
MLQPLVCMGFLCTVREMVGLPQALVPANGWGQMEGRQVSGPVDPPGTLQR